MSGIRSYRRTIDAYAAAEDGDTTAADKLPMSEWAEARRDLLTAQTIAYNHANHASDMAHRLREAIAYYERGTASERDGAGDALADAARALLAAIGEAGE